MVTAGDIGRPVVVCASGNEFAFIDGWRGRLAGLQHGCGVVHVASEEVANGYKVFFVPVDQLALTVGG